MRVHMISLLATMGLVSGACQESEGEPPGDLETSEVSQGLLLGSAFGTVVSNRSTCGLFNGVTPTCGPSSASDESHVWAAPSSGIYTFTAAGIDFQPIIQIGLNAGPIPPLACNDGGTTSSVTLSLSQGQQLQITIDGHGSQCGHYNLTITKACTSDCGPPSSCFAATGCQANGVCGPVFDVCPPDHVCFPQGCILTCLVDPNVPCGSD